MTEARYKIGEEVVFCGVAHPSHPGLTRPWEFSLLKKYTVESVIKLRNIYVISADGVYHSVSGSNIRSKNDYLQYILEWEQHQIIMLLSE